MNNNIFKWGENEIRNFVISVSDNASCFAKNETTSFGTSCVNISPKLAGSEVIPGYIQNSRKLSYNSILRLSPLQWQLFEIFLRL